MLRPFLVWQAQTFLVGNFILTLGAQTFLGQTKRQSKNVLSCRPNSWFLWAHFMLHYGRPGFLWSINLFSCTNWIYPSYSTCLIRKNKKESKSISRPCQIISSDIESNLTLGVMLTWLPAHLDCICLYGSGSCISAPSALKLPFWRRPGIQPTSMLEDCSIVHYRHRESPAQAMMSCFPYALSHDLKWVGCAVGVHFHGPGSIL